jgi:hypothetical protein
MFVCHFVATSGNGEICFSNVEPSAAKAASFARYYGTAEAVPLSKTKAHPHPLDLAMDGASADLQTSVP